MMRPFLVPNTGASHFSFEQKLILLGCFFVALGLLPVSAVDWPQWRGPNRNGLSAETGLLKEWPKDGPRMIWQSKEAGRGYSTPAIEGDYLYLLGNEGTDNEFVRALRVKDGKIAWTTPIGKVGNPDQQPSFPAARSTPTLDGNQLFALGSDGDLACLEKKSGKIIWKKNLRTDFDGKPGTWAFSESPLVDGDRVVCTPGGEEASMVALEKKTGNLVWKCKVPGGGVAAYSSIILAEIAHTRQYVQLLQKGLVGVAAKDGKFLWRWDKPVSKYGANIPTPVAQGDEIYAGAAGTGGGLVRLHLENDAFTNETVYFTPKMPAGIGGTVLLDGFLFGTNAKDLVCLNFKTGEVKWQEPSLGPASFFAAEGMLYVHGENGQVALVAATPNGYHEKGRFTPPGAPAKSGDMEKSWAYPVVSGHRLYLRDHEVLWCYDVKR